MLLYSALEGTVGCTEPLATAAVLAGLLAWGPSRRGAILLGIGVGGALLAKQQGGLLSLGWLGPALVCAASPAERAGLRTLLWVPLSATAAAAIGFAFAGGPAALTIGLASAAGYPARNGLLRNLLPFFLQVPSLPLALLVAGTALATAHGQEESAEGDWTRRALLPFTLAAALATLVQFEKRGYLHYALLTAPMAVVAATAGASLLLRRLRHLLVASPLLAFSLAAVLALQAAHLVSGLPPLRHLILGPPLEIPRSPGAPDDADVAAVASRVTPGEDLLLLAPSQNRLHFVLGTRSLSFRLRYGWAPCERGMALEAAQSPSVHSVLVPAELGPDTAVACAEIGCDQALQALPELGYRPVVQRPTLTLWQR